MFKDGAHYNVIASYLKNYFGKRMAKLAIDAGFSCPNRDGTISTGGCVFCSSDGSGYFAGSSSTPVRDQIEAQIPIMQEKWPDAGFIAYFQSFTNTYAPVDELRSKYYEALAHEKISGIAIATRPDCLSSEILDLLDEINSSTFMWVELGLQTADDSTAAIINRGYGLSVYDRAADELIRRGIRVVTHLIFGLPGETRTDMLASVSHVCSRKIFGLKFHLLTYLYGTALGRAYLNAPGSYRPLPRDEYVSLICDALETVPPEITIHRLTGDAPEELLIAPKWALDKRAVLNSINKELKKRGRCQGDLLNM